MNFIVNHNYNNNQLQKYQLLNLQSSFWSFKALNKSKVIIQKKNSEQRRSIDKLEQSRFIIERKEKNKWEKNA